jgi:CBS domain containing-hemolysin-like protein
MTLALLALAAAAIYLGTIQASFSALMRLSLRILAERSDRPGELGGYLDEPLQLFIPLWLLLGLITATATALLAWAIGVGAPHNVALVVLAAAAFVVVCELGVPVAIAARDPEHMLEMLLPWFSPVARLLGPITRRIARFAQETRRQPIQPPTDEEIQADSDVTKAYLESGEQEGIIQGEERRLLQSIVDFGDTLVREVMTPRPDIVAIPEEATIGELRALFREQEYSRFPVYKGNLDNIAGFAFIKDLVLLDASDDGRPITGVLRPVVVVPETKPVSDLLKQFQHQQTQCAIVVDEYGGTAGLVTIEDLLEEIVGEIRDEYDVESETIVDESNGRFVFSGKVDIDEVVRRLGVAIERAGFETVGGYLMSHLGRVPTVGERFDVDGLSVEVLDAERRRVNKVRIWRKAPAENGVRLEATGG